MVSKNGEGVVKRGDSIVSELHRSGLIVHARSQDGTVGCKSLEKAVNAVLMFERDTITRCRRVQKSKLLLGDAVVLFG